MRTPRSALPQSHAMRIARLAIAGIALGWMAVVPAAETSLRALPNYAQDVVATADIGELVATPLFGHATEIRIWIVDWMAQPRTLIRLRTEESGVVLGETWAYVVGDHRRGRPSSRSFGGIPKLRCAELRTGKHADTCNVRYPHPPDWSGLRTKLVTLGIATLPDESTLPKPEMDVSDGWAIVVEYRDANGYRAYEYSNPAFRKEPEAVAAAKIRSTVDSTLHNAGGVW